MSYRVAFERSPQTLRVALSGGERDFDDTLEAWRAIAAEVQRSPPESVLVVSEVRGAPLTLEQVDGFVRAMRGLGLERLRIAYVYQQDAGWREVETAEILAVEAGFEARAFTDERMAHTWLRHGER
ncbi:hypothetical protein [Cognatilysobacter bugurensis]|uniref:Uncharacterized protein n=1 Tax=Cognatilysobacter bugurensis TaxID=543356 RepID=A0A918SV90_9GAMM|nr:hypothetical protein [Lysobacter bugurensis]GHA70544.1 hypothetical protein GCM10007067_03410 [Lysobacter bugurensis]